MDALKFDILLILCGWYDVRVVRCCDSATMISYNGCVGLLFCSHTPLPSLPLNLIIYCGQHFYPFVPFVFMIQITIRIVMSTNKRHTCILAHKHTTLVNVRYINKHTYYIVHISAKQNEIVDSNKVDSNGFRKNTKFKPQLFSFPLWYFMICNNEICKFTSNSISYAIFHSHKWVQFSSHK